MSTPRGSKEFWGLHDFVMDTLKEFRDADCDIKAGDLAREIENSMENAINVFKPGEREQLPDCLQ